MKTELVTTLKRQATKTLAELNESKEPVLTTEHGPPSACLIDVKDYALMQSRTSILEGIARGEKTIFENRTFSQAEAIDKMSKWLR
ncbi:type II toxin-antitoxin system Phd/YefM family antitoxin [Methylicorpusculum sp.]|uniref:type II toxin-antitoxin system Phd/YefM family antitoxin n=1 Tax=Methylicorpusculum sp. TaxID=2713644 RepID=UPI002732EB54|nr:type II toxin-antitoxin system Phd/YefM family antitoxin [Methylicorpusculum sp.]MDP3529495.1 type II toxin-antitoxin system Phd/YefM family antitoxin [Methylicorpusculum sp.]MDZ4152251.1 type II toxin-antitoxin system Phd/YefM family antitoxin [Methylicorpusculum sp.]